MENTDNAQETEKLQNNNADYEVKKAENDESRETWGGKLDFLMSALSFAVGMGNMWRFPYLCYRNGGGAFLVPYVIMMVIIGIPMVFLEFAFGQFGRSGIVSIWKCCPMFQGVGWGMFLLSLFTSFYYNVLNAWCLFYIGASFAKDVPWRNCGNSWNVNCGQPEVIVMQKNCSKFNGTFFNSTCFTEDVHGFDLYQEINNMVGNSSKVVKSPSDEYFHNYMLDISDGITEPGSMSWKLVLCLFCAWFIVGVCLIKGIKTSGKATYVTALFPYVVLIILFVRGITLEGSSEGVLYYLTPQWHRLKSPKVWVDAGVQVFFSLSVSWGGLITLSSYNNFHNNCMRDAIIVSLGDCLTSIFGGVVVFAFIGYMANTMMVAIPDVATQGAGLAFTVYPQAVTTLPVSQLWSVLFFLMLINVGLGTQFALTQTVQATLVDQFPSFFKKGHRSTILLAIICLTCFLVGLSICTSGGIYVLQLLDNYTASYSLLIFGFTMCIALPWVYGSPRLGSDIQRMIGSKPSIYWIICWKFVSPACIIALLVFTVLDFRRTKYGDVTLPIWCEVVGFMFALVEILAIPTLIIWNYLHVEGDTFMERCRKLVTPSLDWGVHDGVEKKGEEGTEMLPL